MVFGSVSGDPMQRIYLLQTYFQEAGLFASKFFVHLGLFNPSFEVPDIQSGLSVVCASVDEIQGLYLHEKQGFGEGGGWSFGQ